MSGIGTTGIILIVLVALLLFGPKKLPELGRAVGRTLNEFKKGAKEIMEDEPDRQDSQQIQENKRIDKKEDKRLPE